MWPNCTASCFVAIIDLYMNPAPHQQPSTADCYSDPVVSRIHEASLDSFRSKVEGGGAGVSLNSCFWLFSLFWPNWFHERLQGSSSWQQDHHQTAETVQEKGNCGFLSSASQKWGIIKHHCCRTNQIWSALLLSWWFLTFSGHGSCQEHSSAGAS